MDGIYGGLAGPVTVVPAGREDLPAAGRPGTALVALALAARADGSLAVPPARDEDAIPADPSSDWVDGDDPEPPVPDEADGGFHLDGPEG